MSEILLNLEALIESIEKIEKYSNGFLSAEEFYYDEKSFDATMMQFILIGEIVNRIDASFKSDNNHIPWQKIKNFRNIIAHDYFGIDADEIWDILNHKLLPLKQDILEIIQRVKDDNTKII